MKEMREMNEELIGNLTTIIKILIITFVPAAFLETVDANTLATALTIVVMFIFSIIDSKYTNTFKFFGNQEQEQIDVSEEGV